MTRETNIYECGVCNTITAITLPKDNPDGHVLPDWITCVVDDMLIRGRSLQTLNDMKTDWIEVPNVIKECAFCGTDDSSGRWWKCCPKHTTEQGRDVVCESCALKLHYNDGMSDQEVTDNG